MPKITAIEPQRRRPDRFNIFVDGKFRFGLDVETLVKSGLRVGQEVSEEEIEKLTAESETNKLMEKALRFLSFRPRSERELRNHLKKKLRFSNFEFRISVDQVVDDVLNRLRHLGYVDDLEFTKWWVEQRQTHSPRSARLIRSELYQKGVARKIVDEAVPEDGEDEVRRALAAAKKKLRSYKKLEAWEFKQKMGQYLARRGFDWETIREALGRLVDTSSQND